MYMKDVKDH